MSKVEDTKELMDINNLEYKEPAELALVESGSVFKRNNADQNSYSSSSGTEIIVNLQASTDFVYGPNSYMRFDIKADGLVSATADVAVGFVNSPATALFERFLLEDKSGAEVERIEDLNKAVRACLPWKYPDDYNGTCEMAGQSPVRLNSAVLPTAASVSAFALNNVAQASVATGSYLRVCIPLWYFSGIFNEETLMPPQLISGMRFRLTLAPVLEALGIIGSSSLIVPVDLTDTAMTYTINDPVIMLDTYSLALSVQRNIQEQSQSAMGLPYTYETLYYQSGNAGTATAYTQQVNKAVARAQKLWNQTQVTTIADAIEVDNLGSAPLSYFQYQGRVGDWYAPQQTLQLGNTDTSAGVQRNCAELYANNLQNSQQDVCGMCMPSGLADPNHSPSVSLSDYRAVRTASNGGFAAIVQSLNQSPHIGASGIAINNSRTAEVRLRYAADDSTNKQVQTWLQYVKVASIYPSRAVIKQ